MEALLPEYILRVESPPIADWLETFMSVRVHVLVRFGLWQDIILMKSLVIVSCTASLRPYFITQKAWHEPQFVCKLFEPWGWTQPRCHAYAALMLEQGHIEEATKVYSADLGLDGMLPRAHQHPNNIWALQGYHECLTRLGRKTEARLIELHLKLALAVADVPVESSCFAGLTHSVLLMWLGEFIAQIVAATEPTRRTE